jgi:hypothetical protein
MIEKTIVLFYLLNGFLSALMLSTFLIKKCLLFYSQTKKTPFVLNKMKNKKCPFLIPVFGSDFLKCY